MKFDTKRKQPIIYIRDVLPNDYLHELVNVSQKIVYDPWPYGTPEPEPLGALAECDVMLTAGYRDDLKILPKATNLKWVQSTSVGVDMMLRQEVVAHGLQITNTKGCTSVPIAEHVLAMITGLAKKLPHFVRKQIAGEWDEAPVDDLAGKTVGIIGYGEIGYEIARRCKAFGMTVIGCRRNPKKRHGDQDPADQIVGMEHMDEVLAQSDFTILALPSTKETVHIFDKKRLGMLKAGSYLVNIGRGNLIVESDLEKCLKDGRITGAALDVFEAEPLPTAHPFWTMDRVIVTPHRAYYSAHTSRRYMDLFIENLHRYVEGRPLLNLVNKELGY
ncbi:D-2-hydroxyacid dehydrogenase [Sporolactobacillus sp. STCC-11]|uniref:D-2-hydroxyacid dehydrogenase n=1 Tax=Sporolactobacillus caesalpiniae TaxID=3230362 RepID=UPI00339653AB